MKTLYKAFLIIAILFSYSPIEAQRAFFTNTPTTIPDNGCGNNVLTFTASASNVGYLNPSIGKGVAYLLVDITHTYISDVEIYLTSPEGTTVTVFNGTGGDADNMSAVFNGIGSEGTENVSNAPTPYNSFYKPHEDFSAFDYENGDGIWTITVCDNTADDIGTVDYLDITFNTTGEYLSIPGIIVDFENNYNNDGFSGSSFQNTGSLTTDRFGDPNSAYPATTNGPTTANFNNQAWDNPLEEFTLSCWVRPTGQISTMKIAGRSTASQSYLYTLSTLDGGFEFATKVANSSVIVNGGSFELGVWTHVAGTWHRNGSVKLYVDGNLVDSKPAQTNQMADFSLNDERFVIGAAPWNTSLNRFVGDIDNVNLYQQEKTELQIKDLRSPKNDECRAAVSLPVGDVIDEYPRFVDNRSCYYNISDPEVQCGGFAGGDSWFSVVVPSSGNLNIETFESRESSEFYDSGVEVYSGLCQNLSSIDCDIDGGNQLYSLVKLRGRTPGEALKIRVWEYGNNNFGDIGISAYDPDLTGIDESELLNMSVSPNPSNGIVSISLNKELSNTSLTVLDLAGRIVFNRKDTFLKGPLKLDLSHLKTGVYLLSLKHDGGSNNIKFIIDK